MNVWNEQYVPEEEIIRICKRVRELCEMRDSCGTLNKEESDLLIDFVCTY